jgi:hypothetical protein
VRRDDYLDAIRQLGLSPLDYVVTGSGVLGALGLREADDIDLVVSHVVYGEFEAAGSWQRKYYPDGAYGLVNGIYEVGLAWDSEAGKPNLRELKQEETVIDGVPFVSLSHLRAWKQKMGRPKDLADILLIDRYLSLGDRM